MSRDDKQREIVSSSRFRKDAKRMKRRNADMEKLKLIVRLLATYKPLPERCVAHKLSGNWGGCWECHIEPDWLLIYEINDQFVILRRTGTHSDLFGE